MEFCIFPIDIYSEYCGVDVDLLKYVLRCGCVS